MNLNMLSHHHLNFSRRKDRNMDKEDNDEEKYVKE